ncbi:hypothetical protein PV648_05295 [Streptomyces sp. ID05-47C]|nr:hypothetical protein [Streptomyces sp. ID05-47C]MDX3568733.1 hypothetical protein [Streptomyces sp. ID05-47C]
MAKEVMVLNQQVAELDKLTEARVRDHRHLDVITIMPGLGIVLGAEFLAAADGDMAVFDTLGRLAGFGGVAAVPLRLRQDQRQPPAPAAIQPPAPARPLHLCAVQHPKV